MVVDNKKLSAGQSADTPVQVSTVSHNPASARQIVEVGCRTSAGHTVEVPLHVSAASHGPAVARQSVLAARVAQVPFWAAPAPTLQAWQSVVSPPPQALLQHTPSTQSPL